MKRLTQKQLVKHLRTHKDSSCRAYEQAADTIEKLQTRLDVAERGNFVPTAVQFRRGEAEGADIVRLEFECDIVDADKSRTVILDFSPNSFASMMIAALAGLGFAESDLEYVAERYERTFQ